MILESVSIKKEIRKGFVQATFAKKDFMILLFNVKKDKILPNHNHEHTQFGYCLNGEFDFKINSKNYKVGANDFYLLRKKIYHSAVALDDYYALDYKYLDGFSPGNDVIFNFKRKKEVINGIEKETFNLGHGIINKINNQNIGKKIILKNNRDKEYYLITAKKTMIKNKSEYINLLPMNIYKINLKTDEKIMFEIIESEQEFFLFEINKKRREN